MTPAPPPGDADVRIRYHRPPDSTQVFVQRLVHDGPRVKISFAEGIDLDAPMLIG